MKIKNHLITGGILATALAALAGLPAHAGNPDGYSDDNGDLLLGFYESGASKEYFIDLSDLGFTDPTTSFTLSNATSHIGSDLALAFGSTWASQSIYMGIVGTALDSSQVNNVLWVSQPAGDTWKTAGGAGSDNEASPIDSLGNILNGTAQANGQLSGGLEEASSVTNGWNETINPANNDFTGSDGGFFHGTGGDGGVSQLIDGYLPLTYLTDATSGKAGVVEGVFQIDSSGDVQYTAGAVPEPSTYAAVGLGLAVLVFAQRRRFLRA